MVLLHRFAEFVSCFVLTEDSIDLLLFGGVGLGFTVEVQVALVEVGRGQKNISHLMHVGNAFGELPLLNLVFECHFDEFLILSFVVFAHLLQVEFVADQLHFRLVQPDQFFAQLL